MAAEGRHVRIDVADELLALHRHESRYERKPRPCIVRVPESLKKQKREAHYIPELLGLGPYHHYFNNSNTKLNVRSHKLKALDNALRRSLAHQRVEATPESIKNLLQELRDFVSPLESKIKAYYSQDFDFVADVFILDTVFLLELCFAYIEDQFCDRFHSLLDHSMLHTSLGLEVWGDLFKLENQIPVFLLSELSSWKGLFHGRTTGIPGCLPSFFVSGSLFSIKDIVKTLQHKIAYDSSPDSPLPRHLLEFVYRDTITSIRPVACSKSHKIWSSCVWKFCFPKRKEGDWAIPAATELDKVGIAFHESQGYNRLCFKEGRLSLKGHLYLPKLKLGDNSEVMLRNVMAFEEFCVPRGQRFFNRYMAFMKNLIHTERDAAFLINKGIIQHDLENAQSVVRLFHHLNVFISLDKVPEIDKGIVKNLRNYYQNSFRVTLYEFIQTRFSEPWQILGTITAIILLVCTIIQTVYSVKSG